MSDELFLGFGIPVMFLLAGISLLAGAAHHYARARAVLTKARSAFGEVIALETIPPQQPGADEYESYAPVVSFRTVHGHDMRFTSVSSDYPAKYAVGDRVPVLYTADGSEQPRIRSFQDLWLLPVLLASLGAVFATLGGWLLIGGVPR